MAQFQFTSKGTLDSGRFERLCRAACKQFCEDIATAKQVWKDEGLLREAGFAAKDDFVATLEAHVPLHEIEEAVLVLTAEVCRALIRQEPGHSPQPGPNGNAPD